mgnify:CR=1 FL=1
MCRHTGSEQAVESSTRIIRDSMIQKAKDAEPVSPAQHLLFEFLWVRYSKRAYVSHEKLKIIIIETCVSAHVVEETKWQTHPHRPEIAVQHAPPDENQQAPRGHKWCSCDHWKDGCQRSKHRRHDRYAVTLNSRWTATDTRTRMFCHYCAPLPPGSGVAGGGIANSGSTTAKSKREGSANGLPIVPSRLWRTPIATGIPG